jgi:pimeloyl-ACP methyl ester carboxylesterase
MNDGAGRRLNAELDEAALYEILEFPVELGNGGTRRAASVAATRCRPRHADRSTALILLHGGTSTRGYWDLPYRPEIYSFVRWATRAGYATVAVDRPGAGDSSRPPAGEVTIPAQAAAVHQIAGSLRGEFERVVLVGHSLGSWTALLEAGTYRDVDGLVLTGMLHELNVEAIGNSMKALYPADGDPLLASARLGEGYLTTRPGSRAVNWFDVRYAEPEVIELDERTKSLTTSGEIATLAAATDPGVSNAVTAPVLLVVGDNDTVMSPAPCSENPPGFVAEPGYYVSAPSVDAVVVPWAGHNVCLHKTAPVHHAAIIDWLDSRLR